MILVYSLLTENREILVSSIMGSLRRLSREYGRHARAPLKEALSSMFDAYLDFFVSGDEHRIQIALSYWVVLSKAQNLSLSDSIKIIGVISSVIRIFLQDAYRKMPEQEAQTYNKGMKSIEESLINMAEILVQVNEKRLELSKPKKIINLSKMMIFRA